MNTSALPPASIWRASTELAAKDSFTGTPEDFSQRVRQLVEHVGERCGREHQQHGRVAHRASAASAGHGAARRTAIARNDSSWHLHPVELVVRYRALYTAVYYGVPDGDRHGLASSSRPRRAHPRGFRSRVFGRARQGCAARSDRTRRIADARGARPRDELPASLDAAGRSQSLVRRADGRDGRGWQRRRRCAPHGCPDTRWSGCFARSSRARRGCAARTHAGVRADGRKPGRAAGASQAAGAARRAANRPAIASLSALPGPRPCRAR